MIGKDGSVGADGADGYLVDYKLGVRPALKLNLESVIYDSDENTFSLKPALTEYPLWVGGTQVTSANASDIPATNGTKSGTASYNDETKTLTLNGYTYSGEGHRENEDPDSPLAAIYYSGTDPLTIQLSGTNSITRTGKTSVPSSENAYGIHSTNCNLTIDGNSSGSLTVTGGEIKTTYGIYAKTVTIKNADVTAKGIGSSYGAGIDGRQGVTIQNAVVNAVGKSIGISGATEILGNSSVTATGDYYGISASAGVEISENSTVIAAGNNKAINGPVKNAVPGTGWTDKEGTEGKAAIVVSTEGQDLSAYKKVQFPAPLDPVASVTPSGGTATEYTDFAEAVTAWNTADAGATLKLLADVETSDTISVSGVKTLDLNGHGVMYTGSNGSVVTVAENATLTLADSDTATTHYITLDANGRGTAVSDTASDGAIEVTGGYITGGLGSEEYSGGPIQGAGVFVSGSFTMEGGSIVGNTAKGGEYATGEGGGVYVGNGSTFTMNGGTITANTAKGGGESATGQGGGVYVGNDSTFTMTGGAITANTAKGGGEYANGRGGGVYVVTGGAFTMNDGTISGNTASTDGGGVYVTNDCTFTMNDGAVSGNTANNEGGGVYVSNSSTFSMNDGTVTGNTASTNGGGVYVRSGDSYHYNPQYARNPAQFEVSGGVTIKDNMDTAATPAASNVYLGIDKDSNHDPYYDAKITVTGALTNTAPIGVTMQTPGVFTSGGIAKNYAARFTSDDSTYSVAVEGNELKLSLPPVAYMAWDEASKTVKAVEGGCTSYTVVTDSTADFEDGKWYVVSETVEVPSRITVTGTANLILADGKTLTAKKGITVSDGNTLNIYAQSAGTGALVADASSVDNKAAGIGGYSVYNSDTGNYDTTYGKAGTVTIHGGMITATGKSNSAGIGGGTKAAGGTVTIYNGTVTATGGSSGAGIGGGMDAAGGTVTILGGTVKAQNATTNSYPGAGIGAGNGSTSHGTLTVATTHVAYSSTAAIADKTADSVEKVQGTGEASTITRKQYMLVEPGTLHTHEFTYAVSAAGDTITATCGNHDGCPLESNSYQATLTISAAGGTYDGTTTYGATVTNNIPAVDGVTVGEIEYYKVSTQGATTGGTKQTGAPTDAGYYYASVTLTSGSNTYPAVKAFTIAPKALTISGATLTARDYAEGNKNVTVSAVTFEGATLTLDTDYTVTAVMADDTAGNAKSATVTVTLKNSNYSLATKTYNTTVQINKIAYAGNKTAAANLRGISGATAEVTLPALLAGASYGAVTNSNTDYFTVGAVADGKVTVTAAKNFETTETEAKTFTVAVSGATNYSDYTVTVTITPIFKSEQTITAENVTATYGDTGKSVSATTDGDGAISYAVKSGSDVVDVDASTGALTIKKAGTATVTVTAAETDDYAAATKDVTVTVNKKAVTVKADDKRITVGAEVPELTKTVTGLVGSDQEGVLTVSLECEYDADTPGTYTITVTGDAEQGNYTVTYENGTLTISRRPSPSSPSTPTTTVTVPVSGDDETVNVTVRVSGDTATITSADVDKVLEAEDVGTVTIDVSALKQDVSEVVIPGAMVDKIADAVADESNNADGLEIKLPTGTVTFDAEAVAAISEQANGKDLRLNLEYIGENKLNTSQKTAVKDMDVQEVLDAYMTSGGQRISDFKGGKATVTVSYELKDGQTGRGVVVWYVAEDGEKTEVPTTYNDRTVSFTVEHFSNYVIAYDAERAAACPKDDTCPMSSFTDLNPALWYHDGIHFCLENGLMNGVGNNLFDPSGTTSRGMIVTILYRLEKEPEVTAENPFDDVEAGRWYTDAVIWAAENKIVDGYGNGKFGPNDSITREQLATILYRYAQFKGIDVSVGEDTNILSFPDATEVSEWATASVQWAVGSGIINGKDGELVPKGDASRAEAATMLQRFCENVAE